MRRATRRRVRLFLRLLVVGTLIGASYGGFIGRTFRGTGLIGSLVGAVDGATITAAIAAIEIFLVRTRWGRRLQQAPFLVTFGVKWLGYGTVITVVEISRIVGPRNLHNIVLGRYQRPRAEERFFLFVAVAGSSLAERIEPAAVHRFLDAVFPPGLRPHRRLRRRNLPVRRRRDGGDVDRGRRAGRRSPDRLPLRDRGGARGGGAGVRA